MKKRKVLLWFLLIGAFFTMTFGCYMNTVGNIEKVLREKRNDKIESHGQ